jgi:hypothetical protein
MKSTSFLPPVGLLAALVGAVSVSTKLLVSGTVLPPSIDVSPQASQESGRQSTDFAFPPGSDVEQAIALFESRPLLAEGRKRPKQEEAEPPVEQKPGTEDFDTPIVVEESVTELAPVAPPDPPNIAMVGVMESGGEVSVLIRDLLTGEESWHSQNEEIGSWTLAKITQTSVQLRAEGTEITFNLFADQVP